MTDEDFQTLLGLIADESSQAEIFETLDPEALSAEQREEIGLFLRAQALIRAEVGGEEAFSRRVMAWADKTAGFTQRVMDVQQSRVKPVRWQRILPWSLAAAASIAALVSWWPVGSEQAGQTLAELGAVGVLVDEVQAQFSEGRSPVKSGFAAGLYELEQGLAHLRLVNGTDIVLKAPVKFEIENAMRVRLRAGDMRVVVPEMAQGFIVATEGVDYLDLGTEFGVSASPDGKTSAMHVFDGQVDVMQSGKKIESVTLGQGVAFAAGELKSAPAPEPGRYPSANEIGLRRWELLSAQWRRDPSLVAYYSFEKNEAQPTQLRDVKAHGTPLHAEIQGPRWVSGRWAGKQALFFDQNEDHVALTVPGEFASFTVAMWVLLDRLDFANNALFASDGWDPGDFHMNLTSAGKPFGGMWPRTEYPRLNTHPVQLGVWTLVVMSVDGPGKSSRAWVNGRLSTDGHIIPPVQMLTPGTCRIGSCLTSPREGNPVRTIRGRVDEVLIWSRAMDGTEVSRLYEEGRSSLLETVAQKRE